MLYTSKMLPLLEKRMEFDVIRQRQAEDQVYLAKYRQRSLEILAMFQPPNPVTDEEAVKALYQELEFNKAEIDKAQALVTESDRKIAFGSADLIKMGFESVAAYQKQAALVNLAVRKEINFPLDSVRYLELLETYEKTAYPEFLNWYNGIIEKYKDEF